LLGHVSIVPATVSGDLVTISIAVLVWGIGALVVATVLADRRGLLPHELVSFGRWTGTLAAALSLGAAAIHFAVIGSHFAEYPLYGIAFTAFAWFQVGWAAAYLAARGPSVALAAVAVNGGALVVWAVSRTIGLPIGPQPGELEPVGPLDVAAAILEVALIVVLAWDLRARSLRWRPALPFGGAAVVLGTGVLAVILLTSAAFVASGGEAHPAASHGLPIADASSPPPAADAEGSVTPSTGSSAAPAATASSAPLSAAVQPGTVRFGSTLDLSGQIATSIARFRAGDTAVWIADFIEPPRTADIRLMIVQVLPDGREFEHWRQEITVDPDASRLVAGADLSIYVHGGEGSYRLRYLRGDQLLAEGAFEFVP
jgi:hypothetical protein